MRLATLRDGSRDGTLAAASADLARLLPLPGRTLQWLLDDWDAAAPEAEEACRLVESGAVGERGVLAFDADALHSPLPRAYQWADSSNYHSHMERLRAARGIDLPPDHGRLPVVYQSGSDRQLAPTEPIPLADPAWGLDLEATVAVVTGDVPQGTPEDEAERHVRLVMLTNDLTHRHVLPREYAAGVGFYQAKPARAYAPVAVTPDELGEAFSGGLLRATVEVTVNGERLGRLDSAADVAFDFRRVIAHMTVTRGLGAGTIVGSGTISNRDPARGYGCLAEKRAVELAERGSSATRMLEPGDTVRIEAFTAEGASIFGALDQEVVAA